MWSNGTVRRIAREARDAKTTEETRVLKAGQEGLRIGWQETTKDAFGRPLVTKHLNGTETTRNYDCCGVGTETDAEGSATVHSYDALKRPQSVLRGGIVSSYRHDAAGRRLASYRQGTNGTVVQIDSAAYDLSGRLTAQTNALGAVTRMEYLTDAEGQSVTVTTQPDGGTRVETYFQDGSLRSVTGTAVSPCAVRIRGGSVWRGRSVRTRSRSSSMPRAKTRWSGPRASRTVRAARSRSCTPTARNRPASTMLRDSSSGAPIRMAW